MDFKTMKKKELLEFVEGLCCCEKKNIAVSGDAAKIFRSKIGLENKQEHFMVMYLDGANNIIETRIIFIGTLNNSVVHPREVFAPAYELRAASIIVSHNHPSGNISPSLEDKASTKKLVASGEILGINVLDHIIITDTAHYSFKTYGLI